MTYFQTYGGEVVDLEITEPLVIKRPPYRRPPDEAIRVGLGMIEAKDRIQPDDTAIDIGAAALIEPEPQEGQGE